MKKGIAASKGYAIGTVFLQKHEVVSIPEHVITDKIEEIQRFRQSVSESKSQIKHIKESAEKTLGQESAAIFEAHLSFLEDPELIDGIEAEIQNNSSNAIKAVSDVAATYIQLFETMEDDYMRERAADIKDVSKRIIANLAGVSTRFEVQEANTIVVAHDLTPSDTSQLDTNKVIAFLTDIGGRTSHTAIMARTLEIPAVVGLGDITKHVKTGDILIVDGEKGEVIINPQKQEIDAYYKAQELFIKKQEELKTLVGVEAVTQSGKHIEVAGNIGKPEDVEHVIASGGDGIGLFRTEFLYMDRKTEPTEEEQFESYKYVLERMRDKRVVIRTLDIGGDKVLPYLPMPQEMNPFLGYRAIRLCLDKKELFRKQIRALLRASVYGKLCVMFPMISGLEEFRAAKSIVDVCKQELDVEGISYSDQIQWGIMIEIPAAALCADELAKHVDFFSIGTNDLIQYTLAADRMNEKVSYLYDPMHPAVLRLIKMTIDGAHQEGKWVGMCGEMAGDEQAIPTLIAYGLDEFSMSASSILTAKKIILEYER